MPTAKDALEFLRRHDSVRAELRAKGETDAAAAHDIEHQMSIVIGDHRRPDGTLGDDTTGARLVLVLDAEMAARVLNFLIVAGK